jgi:inhibitor of KinA
MGEFHLVVEFGDDGGLDLNVAVAALDDRLREQPIAGILETIPTTRSLTVVWNPILVARKNLVDRIEGLLVTARHPDEVQSRLIRVPVCFDFDWRSLGDQASDLGDDLEFVARHNHLSAPAFCEAITETTYWVTALGFLPGNAVVYPLAGHVSLSSPKLLQPRGWIPARCLLLGGLNMAISPLETASGYRVLGRTPIDIYEPDQRNAPFRGGPALFKRGDRIQYYAVPHKEYKTIREQVDSATYTYDIDHGSLRLHDYAQLVSRTS